MFGRSTSNPVELIDFLLENEHARFDPTEGSGVSSSSTGLILLHRHGECAYINSAAQAILCFPNLVAGDTESRQTVREQIRSRVLPLCGNSPPGTLVSGRRSYVCRTVVLEARTNDPKAATTVVVLQRVSRRNENLRKVCEQYKLTPREREVVILLSEGLTSKEIAQRMDISAHTVKGFVHLIMIKLGVTTRSGIVGKLSCR